MHLIANPGEKSVPPHPPKKVNVTNLTIQVAVISSPHKQTKKVNETK